MATTIYNILDQLKRDVWSQREVGNRFERLIKAYLLTDPLYQDKYSDVWLWSEWPDNNKRQDTGIDLVAKDRITGEYTAIQCKFYDPAYSLQKADIDSFFTASGKKPFTSRMIISTTDHWSKNAEEALQDQHIPVIRLRVQDLANSPINWGQFSLTQPQKITLKKKKSLRPHQTMALDKVIEGFKTSDRGKLIMACGTGKTYTALKIAEKVSTSKGRILFLVPSISLLSQSLREWTSESEVSLHCFAVCSDTKVGKAKMENEDINLHDLAFPATTSYRTLVSQLEAFGNKRQLTVVFSTYQSIKVISEAQKHGAPEFDLVICDEAHRTTGVTLAGNDESYFVKIHDNNFIKARKRLYMTATPRIYSDDSKTKAKENEAVLCSMDDENIFGGEFHRLDFSEAVRRDLLSDYKVMVLAVDEKFIGSTFQKQLADENHELKLEDAVKIAGCWNGLGKRYLITPEGEPAELDTSPMRRAVAFSQSIKASKKFTEMFSGIIDQYRQEHEDDENSLTCQVEHVDGTFNALTRNEKLDWLKEETVDKGNICRILSNARCLAEGVDVPALDAVMFLNPRNSVVDVVQSVGRVMRKAEGKKYGYVILPIGVPADEKPEEALNDHKKYKVVWQVLQALRAHDDRFNATVNQIDLNKKPPDQIQIIGVGGGEDGETDGSSTKPVQTAFNFPNIEEWRNAIYAKIVIKCGDRRYWESWAQDVAQIAERHITRIKALLEDPKPKHRKAFDEFLKELRENINPSVEENDAIEMLAQHLITKPVFDSLFEGYQFTKNNPVSIAMQGMLDLLEGQNLKKETASLDKFYESVHERASGIDNLEGKQRIIIELYEKFFKTAFPRTADRMGIVYTPIEVVDFIINSVDQALKQEFGQGITGKDIHVLDPFTGTGTFMVRLIQSGLIKDEDLNRKFQKELHANEIILLAYYIAAINIEQAYHSRVGGEYTPFEGIVLTDTFQMSEGKDTLDEKMFPENNKRVIRQNKKDIRVIIGNPPYSAGQTSENDANKNLKYPQLDEKIRQTYAAHSNAAYLKNLYDSYIRSIRWASDRIGEQGIVCYVTNGSFIDANAMDGLRKSLVDEFSAIYCFNLRGNARTQGEQRRKEKGNVFGEGTRTPVVITLFIKNPENHQFCQLFYHDIGDYLSREQKLKILQEFSDFKSIPWQKLTPNSSHDWINQRDPAFDKFIALGDKEENEPITLFNNYSLGVVTNRDAWAYNFNRESMVKNMKRMIAFYNDQMETYKAKYEKVSKDRRPGIDDFIDKDSSKISWTRALKNNLSRFISHKYEPQSLTISSYRPFCKQKLYFNKYFNEMVYLMPQVFPKGATNLAICVPGLGSTRPFSALITGNIYDLNLMNAGAQSFPLYYFVDKEKSVVISLPGFDSSNNQNNENISEKALKIFRDHFGMKISKEDLFYYVYGIFHSPEYKSRFKSDLKKTLPRIPFAKNFWAFSKAGRELAKWHLEYETVDPYPLDQHSDQLDFKQDDMYRVIQMKFGKKNGKEDKTTIVYNSHITLTGIPLEAYDYVVNGRPAIEWIMDRYRITIDKASGIKNDPNDWSDDPQYILNLVKRIVRVSLETMTIVNNLPPLEEIK